MKSNKHIAICIILTVIILLLGYPANLVAQVTTINGRNFEKQNGKWFQVENGKSYEVNSKIITIKSLLSGYKLNKFNWLAGTELLKV